MTPEEVILSSATVYFPFFIASYMVLGGGLKYIDDAFDEKTYSKMKAILLSPVIAIFWVFLMYLSPASATILGAIFLAVLFRNKVDNIGFHVGAIAIFCGLTALYLFKIIDFDWGPLVFLTIAGVFDEIGNDYVDAHPTINRMVFLFFEYRFVMKLAVLFLVVAGIYGLEYLLAFIGFDLAYATVGAYSLNLKKHHKYNLNNFHL